MFPRSTQYAIRALSYLAAQPPGKLSGAREIAEAEQIPMPFLWKILQRLAARKLVHSFRGVRGGYELARSPRRITVARILKEMGQEHLLSRCILGFPRCNHRTPCALHPFWRAQREKLRKGLRATTLADLSRANLSR
jgi:Rrf2 family transcriptional regulator, iron-sulfur cluster assembly transcription factor